MRVFFGARRRARARRRTIWMDEGAGARGLQPGVVTMCSSVRVGNVLLGARRRCVPRRVSAWAKTRRPAALSTSGGLGRYWAAQWHLARAVDKRFRELELLVIQPHMAQKPVLRGEVGRACVAREVSVERGGMGEHGCARRLGGWVYVDKGQLCRVDRGLRPARGIIEPRSRVPCPRCRGRVPVWRTGALSQAM